MIFESGNEALADMLAFTHRSLRFIRITSYVRRLCARFETDGFR